MELKAFVIEIDLDYSKKMAARCIESAARYGITVERFKGVHADNARQVMEDEGLEWTWANNNKSTAVCPKTGLLQVPYVTQDMDARIGCAMSHYLLWKMCAAQDDPFLILEHDAKFCNPIPDQVVQNFTSACMVNDPAGSTPGGNEWSMTLRMKGNGLHDKTIARRDPKIPDGLAGNSAYLLRPATAQKLIDLYKEVGVWPNDATMCRQLIDGLQEVWPPVTVVRSSFSTTSKKWR